MVNYIKKPWVFLGAFVLVCSIFLYQFFDPVYYYFRFINGTEMEYGGRCYSVPKGWVVVDKMHGKVDKEHYIVMRFYDNKKFVVHVIYDSRSSIKSFSDYPLVSHGDGYKVYSLYDVFYDDSMKYWLYSYNGNYVITGDSIEKIRFFYEGLDEC